MKKKILFINDEMMIGGVSRILNTFLALLDKEKYEIDLLVLHDHGGLMKEIPEGVNVLSTSAFFDSVDRSLEDLKKERDIKGLFKKILFVFYMKTGLIKPLIRNLRRKLLTKHYDVEFSAKEGFCTIFNACGDSDLKLNWIQTDYEKENYARHHMDIFAWALSRIDQNIACSNGVKEAFEKVFGVHNITVVHNLMDEERVKKLSYEKIDYTFDKNYVNLIAVARFHPQKGLDRLLRALKYVNRNGKKADLCLIGDGILKDELIQQVKEDGMENDVTFLGYQLNPYPYIRQADLFMMTSLFEGYPTITIESLISGTPVFTTEVSGVNEQFRQPYEAIIVKNDDESINKALEEVVRQREVWQNNKKQLENYHYQNEEILAQMEELIAGRFER